MGTVKIFEIKKSIYANNDQQANLLRMELKRKKIFLLNVMSSPGAGKTTMLLRTIRALKEEMSIGVMEADIDSDVDAQAVAASGVRTVQLHTGGMCHLDAEMTKQGLLALGTDGVDLAVLENVGNLVCTAEFDTGASKSAMILSVPEGDDKPLKYPLMFTVADVLLINKIDAMGYFDFNLEACRERVKKLNPELRIFPISAKTGEGMEEWVAWLRAEVEKWRES